MYYSPRIISEHVPDFSSLNTLVASPRFAGKEGEALAVALWELIVDHDLGIFHYAPAQEPLWGFDLYDPLQVLNVYGFTICHVHANLLGLIFRVAGFENVRIANVSGHEGTEVYYDGGWHYFDADLQMYYRLRPPQEGTIASREDLYRDSSLVTNQPHPSIPYHLPDKSPAAVRLLYESTPSYHTDIFEECIHTMDFRLRPGEEMTRYFHPVGRWISFPNYPDEFNKTWHEPGGPTERFWPRRQWGNGYFHYAPRISSSCADIPIGADSSKGLVLEDEGLVCVKNTGSITFSFESPYIYCGVPDPLRRVPAASGASVSATFNLPEGTSARIMGRREPRAEWETLWRSPATGDIPAKIDFTHLTEGQYHVDLQVELMGQHAQLTDFSTRLWFMVSPHSLPALRSTGINHMQLRSGDKYGLCTRRVSKQYLTADAAAVDEALSIENLQHAPDTEACLLPADDSRPWQIVYELRTPRGEKLAWASAYALIQGRKPVAPECPCPSQIAFADTPTGPWRVVTERSIQTHPHGWHFGLWGEGRFSGANDVGYVRFSARQGARGFRLAGHYSTAEETVLEE